MGWSSNQSLCWNWYDVSFGINEVREAWESQRKSFTSEFFEADPCTVSFFYYTPFGQYADVFPW
ncbi:hypothetical protein Gotur_002405, partial [Gossypium turneri]